MNTPTISSNPITATERMFYASQIRRIFYKSNDERIPVSSSLLTYISNFPERAYSRPVFDACFDIISDISINHRDWLAQELKDVNHDFERAFSSLQEINSADIATLDVKLELAIAPLRIIDKHVNPNYLRLVEAVFSPLLSIIAKRSRIDRSVSTDKLDVFNVFEEINKFSRPVLVNAYNHLVRNGIAHGGIQYTYLGIKYTDKKGNSDILSQTQILRLYDEMLGTCNALVAAWKVIFSLFSDFKPPLSHCLQELQYHSKSLWWEIDSFLEFKNENNNQLIVYANAKSRSLSLVQVSAIQTVIALESLCPGYERYFINISSNYALPGFAIYDGNGLRLFRESNYENFELLKGCLVDDLFFYVPNWVMGKVSQKLVTISYSFRTLIGFHLKKRRLFGKHPEIVIREANVHRRGLKAFLNARISVVSKNDESLRELIAKNLSEIIRKAKRNSKGKSLDRYLPLGFARIFVYTEDLKPRQYYTEDHDYACIIQKTKNSGITTVHEEDATTENIGEIEIIWPKR